MNLSRILSALKSCEMAEIRLDRCPLSLEDITECFSVDIPLIATCRISEDRKCEKKLIAAIKAGADYVDVEMDAPPAMIRRISKVAHENGTVVICSYHNFNETPCEKTLENVVEECLRREADIVKVATMANSDDDVERVMSLYDKVPHGLNVSGFPSGLVAFCMGDAGRQSRVECLRRGAPFTYAAFASDDIAAPGQWCASEMARAVYGGFRFWGGDGRNCVTGNYRALQMPSSKSFAQRAIIAAALADGESLIENCTPCSDTLSAIEIAKELGAEVEKTAKEDGTLLIRIKGIAASASSVQIQRLNVGESALLARVMMPISARISSSDVIISGEKTLLDRPMIGAREVLSAFGADVEHVGSECDGVGIISENFRPEGTEAHRKGSDETESEETGSDDAGENECRLPLKVTGQLKSGKAVISAKNGSQLISGLLMALPLGDKDSKIKVTDPKSIPYLLMTLEVLKKFKIQSSCEMAGVNFSQDEVDYSSCTDLTFRIKGRQWYRASNYKIEGDWSSAAAFLVAGAVFGSVQLLGLSTSSNQADCAIIDILSDAGAIVSQSDGETGPVSVRRAPLSAFYADASNCPDLFPVIAVLAAFCQGTSRIGGTDRLAHKECNRADAIVGMLTQAGVKARIEENELVIEGHTLTERVLTGQMLKGGHYTSHHDHRMVMALKIASLGADSPIEIDDTGCVAKSFPDFIRLFDSMLQGS